MFLIQQLTSSLQLNTERGVHHLFWVTPHFVAGFFFSRLPTLFTSHVAPDVTLRANRVPVSLEMLQQIAWVGPQQFFLSAWNSSRSYETTLQQILVKKSAKNEKITFQSLPDTLQM